MVVEAPLAARPLEEIFKRIDAVRAAVRERIAAITKVRVMGQGRGLLGSRLLGGQKVPAPAAWVTYPPHERPALFERTKPAMF